MYLTMFLHINQSVLAFQVPKSLQAPMFYQHLLTRALWQSGCIVVKYIRKTLSKTYIGMYYEYEVHNVIKVHTKTSCLLTLLTAGV